MKRSLRIAAAVLSLIMIALLCACSMPLPTPQEEENKDPRAEYAGVYNFYALKFEDSYVENDDMKDYTVTLKADGTGELYWGENNNGPISEWTLDGNKAVIKAGVSVMNAIIESGVLTIEISDDDVQFHSIYVKGGADTSSMPRISKEEFLAKNGTAGTLGYPGEYKLFGIQNNNYKEYIVDSTGIFDSVITLNEDGTGTYIFDEETAPIDNWKIDGKTFTVTVEGESATGEYKDGVVTLVLGDDESTAYYSKDGADISGYKLISMEEFRKLTGSDD